MAGDSAKHNHQKDMSSTNRNDKSHHSQEKRATSVFSKSVLSPDGQSSDTQDNSHPRESKNSNSNAASNEPSFQPCVICELDDSISPSLKKSRKARTGPPCHNENVPRKKDPDEDEFDMVNVEEGRENDRFVWIDDSDDDNSQE